MATEKTPHRYVGFEHPVWKRLHELETHVEAFPNADRPSEWSPDSGQSFGPGATHFVYFGDCTSCGANFGMLDTHGFHCPYCGDPAENDPENGRMPIGVTIGKPQRS